METTRVQLRIDELGLLGRSPEGFSTAELTLQAFLFAKIFMSKEGIPKDTSHDSPASESQDKIPYLGEDLSQAEYDECCRNLCAFFDILKSWKNGENDESKEL